VWQAGDVVLERTTDQALDVPAFADGTWRWKDEDELAEAVELGILDRHVV
jgi:predicted RNA-binding protein associated with RNAse of E/G family